MANITNCKPVFLFNGTRGVRINLDDVVFVKADHVQCTVVMSDGREHQLSYPLGHLEPMLPGDSFVRIHRQYIINIWHMEMFIGACIKMDNGIKLSVGKTYANALDGRIMVISECVSR